MIDPPLLLREAIREKRRRLGLSSADVAARVGLKARGSIGRYERLGIGLSQANLIEIARLLKFTKQELHHYFGDIEVR